MKSKWISIICATMSLLSLALTFIVPYDLMSDFDIHELLIKSFMISGLIGFLCALISKATKKIFLILYSIIPLLLYAALLVFAFGISER
ncbi:hypothetical protein ACMGE9_01020 [Macrococcus sp. EM39E]|uniref:hypothetical protein n=1 Tax=Macrococcus animalis TaxID=3395467 RepID=UPI0039BE364A